MEELRPISERVEEQALAQWDQPTTEGRLSQAGGSSKITIIGITVGLALIGLAFWQKEFNYALAGVVAIIAPFVLVTQSRRTDAPAITVTNMRIIVGKHDIPLESLAGYWLSSDTGHVVIHLETKKRSFVPPMFLAATDSYDDVRTLFSPLLTELEPREEQLADRITGYFRL